MSTYVDTAQLNGLFKSIYADNINKIIPDHAKLYKKIPFSEAKKVGKSYLQPCLLTNENGFTYAAPDAGVFDLNDSIALAMGEAEVKAYQMVIRSAIGYEAAARASTSKAAFMNTTELVVENMLNSMAKRLEIGMLYGTKGLGQSTVSVNTNATKTVLTITAATWAAGIWIGLENAKINFYNAASLISSGADSIFTVSSVDVANKKITVTGTATGIAALDAAIASSTVTVDAFFYGAKGSEMAGIDAIITNTGTLFGIDASAYTLWKGNTSAVGGNLTMATLLKSMNDVISKGLDEDAMLICSPITWGYINADLSANRRYDGSYKRTGDNGFENIQYYAQNGMVEIVSHPMVKQGEAFLFPTNKVKRIGSTDISFVNPGKNQEYFRELESKAGYELRAYTGQSVFIETPAKTLKFTGITNV
jgi:hypothetical protein